MPETYEPIILVKKARRLRKETKDERFYAAFERRPKRTFVQLVQQLLVKPFALIIAEPMLLAVSTYMAVCISTPWLLYNRSLSCLIYSLFMGACISNLRPIRLYLQLATAWAPVPPVYLFFIPCPVRYSGFCRTDVSTCLDRSRSWSFPCVYFDILSLSNYRYLDTDRLNLRTSLYSQNWGVKTQARSSWREVIISHMDGRAICHLIFLVCVSCSLATHS